MMDEKCTTIECTTSGFGFIIAIIGAILNLCAIFVFCRNRRNLYGQSIGKNSQYFLKTTKLLIWVQIHFFLAPLLFFLALVDFIACGYGITTQSSKLILQRWPLRPFCPTEGLLSEEAEKVNNANCKFNYTILEFIYASSVYLIFLVNFNRAYSLYNQNKASLWFGMKGTSISVALVSFLPQKEMCLNLG